ncbi:methyl-accepting chemotaxis protein [Alishewanella sp. SMS8]|uniref:methyl-accepting chemotaxis protein n=1 Tax=Alishewanella sp. SMS8 TaxID=2994676 RepID=UPI002740B82B|nr:methyl-accepting chemotaxis protein [Alishewanella sp. SMS8]MDP4943979.1 methyl-accepting chemotaxis protein [Alishewanella sp.]MDP5185729.1 methyl-accepting chemotaxis protein [Alishewanella sp.]MDP5458105.1 methyl-accepting chemotaxis protein [Alishewanella sp. SMS8]
MANLTIQTRILLLALIPSTLLAVLLVSFSLLQAKSLGQQGVDSFEEMFQQSQQALIKNYMQLAKSSIAHLYNAPDAATNPAVKAEAIEILRQLRFDDSGSMGYFFIYDQQGVNVMHAANEALQGRNLMDLKDPNGVEVIRGLWNAARSGDGYLYYHWNNTQTNLTEPKLGYAEELSKWGLMLGTGFWIDSLDKQVALMQQKVDQSLSTSFWSSLGTAIASLIVIMLLALVVVRSIITPLKSVVSAMTAIAQGGGDLRHRLTVSGNDELAQLSEAFNRFASQVRDLVARVAGSTSTLNSSAGELNAIMRQATQGVSRQQSESDQVATAMNEMAASSQEVADSAMQASSAAANAEDLVSNSKHTLEKTVQVIDGLALQVNDGVSVIADLSKESDRIGGVLDVIRSIAEQTNLLALNAAIEAARAGEAGRGFAVVADEVRTLASRTQKSTQEIQQMISRLHSGIKGAIELISQLKQSSQSSVEEIRQVELALNQISTAVNTINNMNAQIATAAEEQTHVSGAINENVHQIVIVIEETADGTKRATHTSEQLTELATELDRLVSNYRV